MKPMPRLKERYQQEVVPRLLKEFSYKTVMQVPRLQKVVLNIGLGEVTTNAKAMEAAQKDLEAITGQHPVVTKARRSISAFTEARNSRMGIRVILVSVVTIVATPFG